MDHLAENRDMRLARIRPNVEDRVSGARMGGKEPARVAGPGCAPSLRPQRSRVAQRFSGDLSWNGRARRRVQHGSAQGTQTPPASTKEGRLPKLKT